MQPAVSVIIPCHDGTDGSLAEQLAALAGHVRLAQRRLGMDRQKVTWVSVPDGYQLVVSELAPPPGETA